RACTNAASAARRGHVSLLVCPQCGPTEHELAGDGYVACSGCGRVVEHAPELAEILDGLITYLRRYLATLTDAHFIVLALWTAATWVIKAAETIAYPHFTSAEPESGKTRALEVLELVACGAGMMLDPSAASLYRGLDSGQITTLLIDEIDQFLLGGKADS